MLTAEQKKSSYQIFIPMIVIFLPLAIWLHGLDASSEKAAQKQADQVVLEDAAVLKEFDRCHRENLQSFDAVIGCFNVAKPQLQTEPAVKVLNEAVAEDLVRRSR